MTADEIIAALELRPYPAGGFYRESFRDFEGPDGLARSTATYHLLRAGDALRWHRIGTAVMWHWYAGDALEFSVAGSGSISRAPLGPKVTDGQRPQIVIQARGWRSATPLGPYVLCGCTVTPGFELSDLQVAADGWAPISHF